MILRAVCLVGRPLFILKLFPMAYRVLVFDDSQPWLRVCSEQLAHHEAFFLAGAFRDTRRLAARLCTHRPDLVLMDIQIPPLDGIRAMVEIKEQFPHVKVVIQTVFDDDERIFAALCRGADGYLLKSEAPARIPQLLAEVMTDGAPLSATVSSCLLRLIRTRLYQTPPSPPTLYALSRREQEILGLLTEGLSQKTIADRCHLSFHTVKTHLKNIYHKLEVSSMTEAVAKALRERLVVS